MVSGLALKCRKYIYFISRFVFLDLIEMILQDCKVVFNTNHEVFYSGDIVTGSVTFDFKHSDIVKGNYICFY